jgi:DNA-binding beta-propeller fold protein YncE
MLVSPPQVARGALTGLESRLYVASDEGRRIDVFDVGGGHALHHSITPRLNGRNLLNSRCRGMAAHAATGRLYFTDSDQSNVVALDLISENVLWERRLEKSDCDHPDRLSVTSDGRALYVPCKLSDNMLQARRKYGSWMMSGAICTSTTRHHCPPRRRSMSPPCRFSPT